MVYQNVLSAVVSALAAECIDNTAKQAWQRLYAAGDARPAGPSVSPADRLNADCWVFARLHSQLKARHWAALVARYSTHKLRKVSAIHALVPLIASHAPTLFVDRAVTTWAIPQLKGAEGKRSTCDLIVLPAGWYDMNNWDETASPERTRRHWRGLIIKTLEGMVSEALIEAEQILIAEGVLRAEAA